MADISARNPFLTSYMRDFLSLNLDSRSCGHESCRIKDLLSLSLNFATRLLQAEDEEDLWAALLVAVTAAEGLGFNRAFVLKKDESQDLFRAAVGLGPSSPEEASQIWESLKARKPTFEDMIREARLSFENPSASFKDLLEVLSLAPPENSPLFEKLFQGQGALLLRREENEDLAPFFETLKVEELALATLNIPPATYALILVDNFVTKRPISQEDLYFLETMTLLASMAIQKIRTSQELDRQKYLLVEAEKLSALGELSSKIFHEIRNPISALGGLSKLLLKKEIPPDLQSYLKTMVREAERLERVLEDLFEFVRPIELDRRPVRLYRLLQTALTLFLGTFKEHGIHVAFESEGHDPIVNVDPKEMQLVFIHLIKNALEAMPEGGTLKISTLIDNGVIVRIVDSGTGIPKAYLKKVTEPFFTTKTYGSGLGLSVAKKIVEMHGGTLTLKQGEKVGTRVEVFLPREVLVNGENV